MEKIISVREGANSIGGFLILKCVMNADNIKNASKALPICTCKVSLLCISKTAVILRIPTKSLSFGESPYLLNSSTIFEYLINHTKKTADKVKTLRIGNNVLINSIFHPLKYSLSLIYANSIDHN